MMSPSNVNHSLSPPNAARLLSRDRAPGATSETPSFGDVLRDARTSTPGIRMATPDAASPERMFDAEKPAAHTRRREELKARSQDDMERAAADRRDRRVGVGARRERAEADGVGTDVEPHGAFAPVKESEALDLRDEAGAAPWVPSEPMRGAVRPAVMHPSQGAAESGEEVGSPVAHGDSTSSEVASQSRHAAVAPSGEASRHSQRVVAPPIVPGGATRNESGAPARDIGQWLASRGATDGTATAALSAATDSKGENGAATSSDTAAQSAKQTRSAEKGATPESADKPASFADIVRSLRVGGGERFSSASIRLDPPELGRMFISVRMADGQVRVAVRTETEAALAAVKRGAEELRASLRSLGFDVDAVDVRYESPTEDGAAERAASVIRRMGEPMAFPDESQDERSSRGTTAEPAPRSDGGTSPRGISERRRRRPGGLDVSI